MKATILTKLVSDLIDARTNYEPIPIAEIVRYAKVLEPEVDVFRYIDYGDTMVLFTFADGSAVTYGDN